MSTFTYSGGSSMRCSTAFILAQPEDEVDPSNPYCAWMAYQVKKDHGSESGEKAAGTETI